MDFVIPLSAAEAARLDAAAKHIGLSPVQLIKQLALEHLPPVPEEGEDDLDAKLRRWQEQDGTPLMPAVPAQTLFAQWAEEDAQMTDEEREAEERLWQDFDRGINETRAALGMRLL